MKTIYALAFTSLLLINGAAYGDDNNQPAPKPAVHHYAATSTHAQYSRTTSARVTSDSSQPKVTNDVRGAHQWSAAPNANSGATMY